MMASQILLGDCREVLRSLPENSVHCCVSSPPYFGLRDYGTGSWEGGDPECEHIVGEMRRGLGLATSVASTRGGGHKAAETPDIKARAVCPHCGARRVDQQIGLEPTPAEFIETMVAVFREVRRVLRDDGTLWLNLGDSYAGSGRGGATRDTSGLEGGLESQNKSKVKIARAADEIGATARTAAVTNVGRRAFREGLKADRADSPKGERPHTSGVPVPSGFKEKDLFGIPWRVALALQADGWHLRQDIIWHKPNPMPESVRDRCTKAHEYIFLLSKSPRYFFDHAAIMEPSVSKRSAGSGVVELSELAPFRNRRSVWTISTKPFKAAHFATFPPDLIEPCILAGSPLGGAVLDPFFGAGTTGLVAERNGRSYIGIELNPEYVEIAQRRILGSAEPIDARRLLLEALAA